MVSPGISAGRAQPLREVEGEPGGWVRRVSEMWGAAGRERVARWLTGRAAPSVGCVRAVRVGLKRREGGSACWAAGAGEGEECDAGRVAVAEKRARGGGKGGGELGCWGAWAGLTLGFLGRVLGFSWAGGFGLLGSFPFYF